MYLKTHWTPEEAYSLLMLLDELRDVIWQNYRSEIIEYCHQKHKGNSGAFIEIEDDIIPF
jgi:hypothetical protein